LSSSQKNKTKKGEIVKKATAIFG